MTVAVHVTYRGERGMVNSFVSMLEAEGLTLARQTSTEHVGAGEVLLEIRAPTVSGFGLDAILASVRAAIASFKQRFPWQDTGDL